MDPLTLKILALGGMLGSFLFALPYPIPVPMPPAKPQSAFERHWDQLVELGRKRNNGVLLTAKVKEHTANRLVVEWGFDYTGPRPPLTMLSPVRPDSQTLYPYTTSIDFFAIAADGSLHGESYSTGQRPWLEGGWQKREYFLTVERGKRATVEVTVPIREILKQFKDEYKYPTQFQDPPAKLYFRLGHAPVHRGEEHGLDAWTGSLVSEPILLDLKSWD